MGLGPLRLGSFRSLPWSAAVVQRRFFLDSVALVGGVGPAAFGVLPVSSLVDRGSCGRFLCGSMALVGGVGPAAFGVLPVSSLVDRGGTETVFFAQVVFFSLDFLVFFLSISTQYYCAANLT